MVFSTGAFYPQGFGFTVGYSEKVVGKLGREGRVGAGHFISLADFETCSEVGSEVEPAFLGCRRAFAQRVLCGNPVLQAGTKA
jgi:hypothetical protein